MLTLKHLTLYLFFSIRVFGADAGSFDPNSERIMEVVLNDGKMMASAMVIYPHDPNWLIPFTEFVDALTLAIQVSPKLGKAEGFIFSEERRFSLDLDKCLVSYGKTKENYPCEQAKLQENEIYLDSVLIQKWFPLSLRIDPNRSQLIITPREKLPEQLREDREQILEVQKAYLHTRNPGYPRLDIPYQLVQFPFVDQQLTIGKQYSSGDSRLLFQHTTEMSGELLGHETLGYVVGTEKKIDQWQATIAKHDADGALWGPLKLTEYRFLTVPLPALPLIGSGTTARGIYLSSYPLSAPDSFGTQNFTGVLAPGWDVELSRNNFLLDRKTSDSAGIYEFRNVTLLFGRNEFKLTFYGPRGERRVEYKTYQIDSSILSPGRSDYRLGLGMISATDLHPNTTRLALQYERSLLSWASLSSGVQHDFYPGRSFGVVGMNAFLLGFLTQSSYALSDLGGSAYEVAVQTGLGPLTLSGRWDQLFNYESELLPRSSEKFLQNQLVASASTVIPLVPAIGVDFEFRRKQYEPNLQESTIRNLLTTNIADVNFLHEFTYNVSPQLPWKAKLDLTWIGLSSILRFGNAYSSRRLDASNIEITYRKPKNYGISLSLSRQWQEQVHQIRLVASRFFSNFSVGLDTTTDGKFTHSIGLQFAYSFLLNPITKRVHFFAEPVSRGGAASIQVFRDKNRNGVWDDKDLPVVNAYLSVNHRDDEHRSDSNGQLLVTALTPHLPVDISILPKTFDTPFLKPSKKGVRILPRQGKMATVELAVNEVGQVDGYVFIKRATGLRGKRSVKLELLSTEGKIIETTKTDADGFYAFESVSVGAYRIRVHGDELTPHNLKATPKEKTIEMPDGGAFITETNFELGEIETSKAPKSP